MVDLLGQVFTVESLAQLHVIVHVRSKRTFPCDVIFSIGCVRSNCFWFDHVPVHVVGQATLDDRFLLSRCGSAVQPKLT